MKRIRRQLRLNIVVTEEEKAMAEALTVGTGLSVSAVVREMIREKHRLTSKEQPTQQ